MGVVNIGDQSAKLYILIPVAAILLYVSVPLYCVGYATPYWLKKDGFPKVATGLWVVCTDTNTTYQNDTEWTCYDSKTYVVNGWGETWIPGVRALATLGLLFLVMSLVISSAASFRKNMYKEMAAPYSAMAAAFSSGLFSLIVISIYGLKKYSPEFKGYSLSWSFIMYCLAVCIEFTAGGILSASVYFINREAVYRKLTNNNRVAPASAAPSKQSL